MKTYFSLLAAITLLLHTNLSLAETSLFGPETFVRTTAKPQIVSETFTMPPTQDVVLTVHNGGINHAFAKVSSARVSVNGVEVLSPNKFNQKVTSLAVPIGLNEGVNLLEVELRSKPGSALAVEILGVALPTLLPPGVGATIFGPQGTSLTVQPNTIPYEVLIAIEPAPSSKIVASTGSLPLVSVVEVMFEPVPFNASFLPPDAPFEISVPASADVTESSKLLVAQQMLVDFVSESESDLREQLVPLDTAAVVGGNIVTQTTDLPGIFSGGTFAIVKQTGSGFATGIVSQKVCFLFVCFTIPRPGVVVSNSTNTLVAVTNALGRYNLFISGGPFTVTGFDPFRGSSGSALGNITVPDSTVTADFLLVGLTVPPITRDGIRNSGFERGNLSSWACAGACSVRQQLIATGKTIVPTEGVAMADINTGPGSIGATGSALTQEFIVPAGVRTLRLDFNFVSEEFPEFVGSIFDDSFQAIITTPAGQSTFAQVSVNASGGFTLIGNCNFPGGDSTCGETGWRQGSVDLSAWSGTATPITVQLLFSTVDAGDNIFDTHVLVDNIRFSTLWIDAKILQGPTIAANANAARVQNEVRQTNEILSQAGMNVRIRNTQTVATTDALVDTNITWTTGAGCGGGLVNGILTAEEIAVLALARSATNTDLNVYYVRSGTGLANVGGFALGPDDFCVGVNILTNSGTFQMDIGMGGNVLSHEIGHIIISPATAGNALEHSAPAGNFLSTTPALGVVNRQQSANINRAGAPLPVP